jgi:hypothetical protein
MCYIVYKITNIVNEKIYIGQTTETLEKRFKRHSGYQLNDNTYLHRAMKKYGVDNFKIEEIERVKNQKELDEREYYWIHYYNSHIEGYNLKSSIGKCGGDTLSNNKNIKSIKEKISESKKLDKNPNATKIKAINIKTQTIFYYNSMKECQIELNIERHDIISRRCKKIIKKAYNDEWLFEYI